MAKEPLRLSEEGSRRKNIQLYWCHRSTTAVGAGIREELLIAGLPHTCKGVQGSDGEQQERNSDYLDSFAYSLLDSS